MNAQKGGRYIQYAGEVPTEFELQMRKRLIQIDKIKDQGDLLCQKNLASMGKVTKMLKKVKDKNPDG